ncbi:MAG: Lrp/AsnC family transcriptional regulator [Candidatus Freyarchaeota archaeon]
MSQRMDRVDKEILKFLQKDARTPFTEIGKRLGISDATVHVRVKKMWKAGIIKRYTVVVDEGVFGRGVTGYLLMSAENEKVEEVSKRLAKMEFITMVQEVHGTNNILIKIGTSNLEKLRDAVTMIRKIPGVAINDCLMVLKTWKEE